MIKNKQFVFLVEIFNSKPSLFKGKIEMKKDHTKKQLAEALKQLLKQNSLKNITIQSIVDYCDLNRGTFYYHFYDRQELINWIYHNEITKPTRSVLYSDPSNWASISTFGLDNMLQNKSFYTQALKLSDQNNLSEYMRIEIEKNWDILIERYIENYYPQLKNIDMSFFSSFIANGAWAMLIKWVRDDMKEDPKVIANMIDTIQTASMEAIIHKYLK